LLKTGSNANFPDDHGGLTFIVWPSGCERCINRAEKRMFAASWGCSQHSPIVKSRRASEVALFVQVVCDFGAPLPAHRPSARIARIVFLAVFWFHLVRYTHIFPANFDIPRRCDLKNS
jgi:hypothetical protein